MKPHISEKFKHKCSISKILSYIIKCHLLKEKDVNTKGTGNSYIIQSVEGRQTEESPVVK